MKLMVGSNGPRMLRITAAHVDMWNTWHVWFGNTAAGLAPVVAEVEAACAKVDRDPTTLEKTAAIYVQLPDGEGRIAGSTGRPTAPPITGTREQMAETLSSFAEGGMDHIQLVLDPIDSASVEELAEVVVRHHF